MWTSVTGWGPLGSCFKRGATWQLSCHCLYCLVLPEFGGSVVEEQCGGREGDRYHRLRGLGVPLPGAKAPGKTLARPGHRSSCTRHSFGKRGSFLHYEDPERNSNSSSETPTSANSWKVFPPLCPEMLHLQVLKQVTLPSAPWQPHLCLSS